MLDIQNKLLKYQKEKEFNAWELQFREHLIQLHEIFNKYYFISYEKFVVLTYNSSISFYDYKKKRFYKPLI